MTDSHSKDMMRIARGILIFVGGIIFALAALVFLWIYVVKSPYLRFMDKSERYYGDFTRACDLVLQQHPLGTNEFIRISHETSPVSTDYPRFTSSADYHYLEPYSYYGWRWT
jgi:hypothetical protein